MNNRVFLFTARYPYVGAENFLEDEIVFLSKVFKVVYVIPFLATDLGCREMPDNCILGGPIVKSRFDFIKQCKFSWKVFKSLILEFFGKQVYFSKKRFKVWLTAYVSSNIIINSPAIKKIGKDLEQTDVCYFYWGKWSNVLSVYWKGKAVFVSRFHGQWDLWEEEYDSYAPLRKIIANSLSAAVFISEKGEKYFHERYPECKTYVFRLGTKNIGRVRRSTDEWLRVLSCSTIYPLKRVDLILQSVAEVSKTRKIEWTHLGGGEDYGKIYEMANKMVSERLRVNMPGQMTYTDVLEYYKYNSFDIFVNLSTNEGIPVSIMEAISCDVPIVATNVGGTAEIVNEETGILVSENPKPQDVAQAIIKLENCREKYTPRKFWCQNYMADINYDRFASFLSALSANTEDNKIVLQN